MPEGDSIYFLAAKLTKALVGKKIRAFTSQKFSDETARSLVDLTVSEVVSKGKNLLIRFADGRALHIHLKMLGRVYVTDPVALARKNAFRGASRAVPQLRIDVDGAVIFGSKIPVLSLVQKGAEARAPNLASLGPDLLAADFDAASAAEILRRFRAEGAREVGDALMQQSVLAGIGNVYKSEVMFIEKVNPRSQVSELENETLERLVARARKLLVANVTRGGPRFTRSTIGARFYVYRRAGKRCFSCGGAIGVFYQGAPPGRSTYFCERCQSVSP